MISIKRIGNIYILFVLTQSLMSNRNKCLLSLNAFHVSHETCETDGILYRKSRMNGMFSIKGLYLVVKNKCQVLVLIITTADDKYAIFCCCFFFHFV